jgi:hypothetical protein
MTAAAEIEAACDVLETAFCGQKPATLRCVVAAARAYAREHPDARDDDRRTPYAAMIEDSWRYDHAAHGEIRKTFPVPVEQPRGYSLAWLWCRCGARLLVRE